MTAENPLKPRSPDDDMQDPVETLLAERRPSAEDAEYIAEFLDTGALIAMFREGNYNAKSKIARLIQIFDTGTPSQSMQAMKLLDEAWGTALMRRGALMRPIPSGQAGTTEPIGLPMQQVESVEIATRSVRLSLASAQQYEPSLQENPDGQAQQAPAQEQESRGDDRDGDDDYFPDERDTQSSIHRPPTRAHGQQTAI